MKRSNLCLIGLPLIVLLVCSSAVVTAQVSVADCATCHVSIASEWESSLHSRAYTSPPFVADKSERDSAEDPSCNCHGPGRLAPDYLGKRPPIRESGLESGVDCIACHLDTQGIVWSSGEARYVPHWTRQSAVYSSEGFCLGCHELKGDDGISCLDCHMAIVAGPSADGPHMERRPQATHRSHLWAGSRDPEVVTAAVEMDVQRVETGLLVEVTNIVPAHAFPVVERRVALVVLVDRDSAEVLWEQAIKVPADSSVTLAIDQPSDSNAEVQLWFYPARSLWPDRYYVLERVGVP